SSFLVRRLHTPTLFPYTTLFRSCFVSCASLVCGDGGSSSSSQGRCGHNQPTIMKKLRKKPHTNRIGLNMKPKKPKPTAIAVSNRSEEHTSELQSRENLVCRLLLE